MLVEQRAAAPTTDTDDLDALVARAGEGDVDAFRRLFERFHDRVYRYALLRLRDPEAAQDVTQDVFVAVWNGLPRFRPNHEGSFPAWVFAIARRVVVNHVRRARRSGEEVLVLDGSLEFEGRIVASRTMVSELSRLPEQQREVIVLRFIVGLSGRETADALGRSEGAVTALQMRGLKRLREQMETAR